MYDRLPYFYITGGDPILHPDFWPLLELLAIKRIPFTLMGNPFHLTDEVCQRLKLLGCEKYQLSIDGLEQTHDWFRKPGSFQTTLEKIATINRAGIRSVVMTTVSGTNIHEVPTVTTIQTVYKIMGIFTLPIPFIIEQIGVMIAVKMVVIPITERMLPPIPTIAGTLPYTSPIIG